MPCPCESSSGQSTGYDKIYPSLMTQAMEFAEVALSNNEVPIAALLHHPKFHILGKSFNLTNKSLNGTNHAELNLYNEIKLKFPDNHLQIWQESTLYVTVEPCIMCASLLDQLKIKRVIFGAVNERFGGNGSVFNIGNYQKIPGVGLEMAVMLLRRFYILENERSPDKINKKERKINFDQFPILNYANYIDRETWINIWGDISAGLLWDKGKGITLEGDTISFNI
ncbi:tRNA(adenine34) deaminase [Martiniozyma asiatica (nom. inval.)]|nr:tRNA(adenine34) deaminase [Martiniozyma asiatica]